MTFKHFLAATMLLLGVQQMAIAQQKSNAPQSTPSTSRPGVTRPAHIDIRNDYVALQKEPQNLPDMPVFSGTKKFVSGFQTEKNGLKVGATYHTNSSQQDVMNFYRQALKQYGWRIQGKEDAHNLGAVNKKGNACVIHVLPSNDPSLPTEYVISLSMK